ncbi:unnamed protein product, partial [Ectocarpus sp. 4 AP-2014]
TLAPGATLAPGGAGTVASTTLAPSTATTGGDGGVDAGSATLAPTSPDSGRFLDVTAAPTVA